MPNGTHAAPADATSDPPPALKAKPALADASAEQRELPDVRANPGAAKIPFMSLCLTPAIPYSGSLTRPCSPTPFSFGTAPSTPVARSDSVESPGARCARKQGCTFQPSRRSCSPS